MTMREKLLLYQWSNPSVGIWEWTLGADLLPEISRTRYWQPKKWGPRHRLAVMLHLSGLTNGEISERLGWDTNRVSVILNDPRAKADMEKMGPQVADKILDTGVRLKLYSGEALDEIVEELRTAKDVKVRQKAAFGLLDRAGYSPAKLEQGQGAPTLPAEVVKRVEAATREIIQAKVIYDGDAEPIPKKEDEGTPEHINSIRPEAGEPRGPVMEETNDDQ